MPQPFKYDPYTEVIAGWTPHPCGYENNVLMYNWGEWENPVEFILASLLED